LSLIARPWLSELFDFVDTVFQSPLNLGQNAWHASFDVLVAHLYECLFELMSSQFVLIEGLPGIAGEEFFFELVPLQVGDVEFRRLPIA
jgi:hypothetical protein